MVHTMEPLQSSTRCAMQRRLKCSLAFAGVTGLLVRWACSPSAFLLKGPQISSRAGAAPHAVEVLDVAVPRPVALSTKVSPSGGSAWGTAGVAVGATAFALLLAAPRRRVQAPRPVARCPRALCAITQRPARAEGPTGSQGATTLAPEARGSPQPPPGAGPEGEPGQEGKGAEDSEEQWNPAAPALMALAVFAAVSIASDPALAEDVVKLAEDAAEVAEDVADDVVTTPEKAGDWFDPFVNFNAGIIAGIDDVIEDKLKIPNTFGFAIILYTFLVKVVTYPLNQASLRSGALMQLIQPRVKQIQAKYKNDQETQQRMMLRLFDDCGVSPLSGCFPTLVQFPIFIGLYRAINKLAEKNIHFKEPFLWIPSLAGPVSVGKPSIDWLIKSKFEDHFEPQVGWQTAGQYIILPIILIFSQIVTQQQASPTTAQQQNSPLSALTGIFPLIIGYTTLISPSGLGLYWLTNNLLTQGQTRLIRNGLAKEYPEYEKILKGESDKPEPSGTKKPTVEEVETTLGKGFAMIGDESDSEPAPSAVKVAASAAPEAATTAPKGSATRTSKPAGSPSRAAAARRGKRRSKSSKRR